MGFMYFYTCTEQPWRSTERKSSARGSERVRLSQVCRHYRVFTWSGTQLVFGQAPPPVFRSWRMQSDKEEKPDRIAFGLWNVDDLCI